MDDLPSLAGLLGAARREGAGWRCLCPSHIDRSPSLSLKFSESGKLLVKCWSGCDSRQVLSEIRKITGAPRETNNKKEAVSRPTVSETPEWVHKLWHDARILQDGDLSVRYLRNRGIPLNELPEVLRFAPACKISGVDREHQPALLARFDDSEGKFSTVHRTYIQEPGRKADIDRPKRIASSPARGGAIRLIKPTDRLGIAEGIETALACYLDTGIPTWATYSATLMPLLVVPPGIKEVIIFGDNDLSGAGQKAADQLQARLLSQGILVKTLIPPVEGRDWLDILVS